MLGFVLLVMVGEQAQELQLAGWIPTTRIDWLANLVPDWMGVWFAVYRTIETLVAQLVAAVLVIGSVLCRSRADIHVTPESPRCSHGLRRLEISA